MLLNYDELPALHKAVFDGNIELVTSLLSAALDINEIAQGYAPLHIAAEKGHKDIVAKLLESGADINAHTTEDMETPLNLAVQNNHITVVETLLANENCNIEIANKEGWTSLHVAAYDGRAEII